MLLWTRPEPGTSPPTLAEILFCIHFAFLFVFFRFVFLHCILRFVSFIKPGMEGNNERDRNDHLVFQRFCTNEITR